MKPFIFELKLHWIGFYGNLLEWIPRIHVFISDNPSIKLKWMGIELSLWCGVLGNVGKGFYLTPSLIFKHLNKEYKEKYDFQFSWLNINYRKLIGERVKYKTVLAEELNKPIDWKSIFINMEIDFDKYDYFIAECYEAEDEFWEDVFDNIETDYWVDEAKNL